MEITNKLDPGFTALAISLFSCVNLWLMDSRSAQPTGAQGDGGQTWAPKGGKRKGWQGKEEEAEEDLIDPHMQYSSFRPYHPRPICPTILVQVNTIFRYFQQPSPGCPHFITLSIHPVLHTQIHMHTQVQAHTYTQSSDEIPHSHTLQS